MLYAIYAHHHDGDTNILTQIGSRKAENANDALDSFLEVYGQNYGHVVALPVVSGHRSVAFEQA